MSRPASAEAAALILVVALHYRDASGAGFPDSIEQAERLLGGSLHSEDRHRLLRANEGSLGVTWKGERRLPSNKDKGVTIADEPRPALAACCDLPKTRGPNVAGQMVCPAHCSKCGHDRKHEDYLDFCSVCEADGGPCAVSPSAAL